VNQSDGTPSRGTLGRSSPNPYEDPRCQETDYPYERIFAVVFPLFPFQRRRDPGGVLTAFPDAGAGRVGRHHTLLEALSPS
jgi:hypothetical protein